MKKILIVVGIIVLVVVVDAAIRLLWPDPAGRKTTPEPLAPPLAGEETVDGDQDRTGWLEGGQPDPRTEQRLNLVRDRVACDSVAELLTRKRGRGITRQDLTPVGGMRKDWARETIPEILANYMTCRALEERSYAFCTDAEALEARDPNYSCLDTYSVFLSISAAMFRKLEEDAFTAELAGLPESIQKTMLAIFRGARNGDGKGCEGHKLGKMAQAACRVLLEPPAKAPDDPLGSDLFYLNRLLVSGDKGHISRFDSKLVVPLAYALIGEPGHCDQFLTRELAQICRDL